MEMIQTYIYLDSITILYSIVKHHFFWFIVADSILFYKGGGGNKDYKIVQVTLGTSASIMYYYSFLLLRCSPGQPTTTSVFPLFII